MKRRALTPLLSCLLLLPVLLAPTALTAQKAIIPLWPQGTPEPPQTTEPEKDVRTDADALISGHISARITNVTQPTISLYPPPGNQSEPRAAALVFPGGSYKRLAWDGEGTDTCKWLNSIGMTCLLVKYRVPEPVPYPDNPADLEDAQQAMRLARTHAADWHLDPARIGVVGFSAGGNLAILLGTHPDDSHVLATPAAPQVNARIDARPNFAIIIYPAYLGVAPAMKELETTYTPNQFTPPTFLLQAEDDKSYGLNALLYYRALMDAKVPAELHMYPTGGHGFGLHPVGYPEEHWTRTATEWLERNRMTTQVPPHGKTTPNSGWPITCPNPEPPIGPPSKTPQPETDPACW